MFLFEAARAIVWLNCACPSNPVARPWYPTLRLRGYVPSLLVVFSIDPQDRVKESARAHGSAECVATKYAKVVGPPAAPQVGGIFREPYVPHLAKGV